ncbi:MAG: DUF1844 domain-containing protein [Desulfoplanes sp.]
MPEEHNASGQTDQPTEIPKKDEPHHETEKRVKQEYTKTSQANDSGCMPKLDFSTFVMSLSSTVLVHLGEIPDIQTGMATPNIPLAKQTIDILTMLQEKTQGNLTGEETRLIRDLLFELRVKFIQRNP